jgi:hypothetical protein
MNLHPSTRRLKLRQQEHQACPEQRRRAHLRGLPAPRRAVVSLDVGRGESPQGDLVPFVAANSFAGLAFIIGPQ